MYSIHMGVPEMNDYWTSLNSRVKSGAASKNEIKQYKLLGKAIKHLAADPRYPGLQTHEISELTNRYGMRVWQSYLSNNTPSAGRIYWVYGPNKDSITIIGIEPHPNDKSNSYKKITLSSLGQEADK